MSIIKIAKLGFINKMMKKGQESKGWNIACRWLVACGIGSHIFALFLLVMALI